MHKIIPIVSHPELCSQIVGQFVFMKIMSKPEDRNFFDLQEISLDEVFRKADEYFVQFTAYEEIIDSYESDLETKIKQFLSEWKDKIDIVAVQQNIHYNLMIIDKKN